MLKILQVGKYYPPVRGGMETHLESLCQGLRDHVDLEVVVSHLERETVKEEVNGVFVRRLGTLAKVLGAPLCPGLRRAMKHSRADIVHIHLPNPTALLAYLLSGTKATLVITYHSDIIRQRISRALISPMQERALRCAAAIFVSSPNLIRASSVLQRHRDRCQVVPFGFAPKSSMTTAKSAQEAERLRTQFGGGPLLLAVGRMVYYKGFDVLIDALHRVPDAKLILIGDGPLRGQLEEQIQRLQLQDRVHLVGDVLATDAYYEACDFLVLSSVARSEAFGLVQLEAMARGKPVINTDLASGVPSVSLHGQTGLTVEPGNVEALAGAIRWLSVDDKLRRQFGRAARHRVDTHFTIEQMVSCTLNVYQSILFSSPMGASDLQRAAAPEATEALYRRGAP